MNELIRVECVESLMDIYTKGKKYCFVQNGDIYIGFSNKTEDENTFYKNEMYDYFDVDNAEIIEICKENENE